MLSVAGLGRLGRSRLPTLSQSASAHGALDYYTPEPRKAPGGVYQPEGRPEDAWQLPVRKEFARTEQMVAAYEARSKPEGQALMNDQFPHPHSLEGNFMHFQNIQDARFPDWATEPLRNAETSNPHQHRAVNHALGYKFRQSITLTGLMIIPLYLVKNVFWSFISAKYPTREKFVRGVSEVDTSKVEQGHKGILATWRGKPVFIRHRSAKQVEKERAVDHSSLRDPESDEQRAANGRPEWVIMIGICTHLGCLPIAGEGEYGGYYCPCHGSHYDTAGRIRKGPAPLNLEIPEHEWKDENTLVIGKL